MSISRSNRVPGWVAILGREGVSVSVAVEGFLPSPSLILFRSTSRPKNARLTRCPPFSAAGFWKRTAAVARDAQSPLLHSKACTTRIVRLRFPRTPVFFLALNARERKTRTHSSEHRFDTNRVRLAFRNVNCARLLYLAFFPPSFVLLHCFVPLHGPSISRQQRDLAARPPSRSFFLFSSSSIPETREKTSDSRRMDRPPTCAGPGEHACVANRTHRRRKRQSSTPIIDSDSDATRRARAFLGARSNGPASRAGWCGNDEGGDEGAYDADRGVGGAARCRWVERGGGRGGRRNGEGRGGFVGWEGGEESGEAGEGTPPPRRGDRQALSLCGRARLSRIRRRGLGRSLQLGALE